MSRLFDESHWPVVIISAHSDRGLDASIFLADKLDEILARKTDFVLVSIFNMVGDEKSNPEAANYMMKWLKPNKPLITQYCRGMVTVCDSPEYHEKYGPRLMNQGPQIYGCQSNLVYTLDEAMAWANKQLASVPNRT